MTIDALDTWRDWAAGKALSIERLASAVRALTESRDLTGAVELGNVAGRWA